MAYPALANAPQRSPTILPPFCRWWPPVFCSDVVDTTNSVVPNNVNMTPVMWFQWIRSVACPNTFGKVDCKHWWKTIKIGAHCDRIDDRIKDVVATAQHNPILYMAHPQPARTESTEIEICGDNPRILVILSSILVDCLSCDWDRICTAKPLGTIRAKKVVCNRQLALSNGGTSSSDLRTENRDDTMIVPVISTALPTVESFIFITK